MLDASLYIPVFMLGFILLVQAPYSSTILPCFQPPNSIYSRFPNGYVWSQVSL